MPALFVCVRYCSESFFTTTTKISYPLLSISTRNPPRSQFSCLRVSFEETITFQLHDNLLSLVLAGQGCLPLHALKLSPTTFPFNAHTCHTQERRHLQAMSALTIAPKTLVPGEVLDEKTFQTKLSFLSSAWDLRLDPNSPSPTKDEQKPLGHKCVSKLRFCYYKGIYLRCSQEFTRDATILQQKWVRKPRQERGTIPDATRQIPRPVSNDQREELLCCLYAIAKDHADAWQKINGGTPRRLRQKIEEMKAAENTQPIPIALPHISTSNISPSSDSKRRRDDEPFADLPSQSKKQKAPEPQQRVPSPIMAPPRNCFVRRESMQSLRSANTSFNTSFAESVVSSVFSQRANDESGQNTQSTVPDEEPQLPSQSQLPTQSNAAFVVQSQAEAFITPQPARSTYGSSSFEDTVADLRDEDLLSEPSKSFGPAGVLEEEISQDLNGIALDAEAESREILNGIFRESLSLPEVLVADQASRTSRKSRTGSPMHYIRD